MSDKIEKNIENKLDQIRRTNTWATKEPWYLATGNSWRRILQDKTDQSVIEPTKARDGWPDLLGSHRDMELACEARNRLPKFLRAFEDLVHLAQVDSEVSSATLLEILDAALRDDE
jgi:hypothetical protein